ncbi:MAG: hypothetical protein EXS32_01820 [Opitutus sp.]|nr:hypothetical protein [Opitutus sp.]
MKMTVKFLLSLLALGLVASSPTLSAQEKPVTGTSTPTETPAATPAKGKGKGGARGAAQVSPEQRIADLDKTVTLTDEQKTKVREIFTKADTEAQTLSKKDARTKLPGTLQAARTDVRALLTDDQQKKFDAMPSDSTAKRGKGKGKGKKTT